MAGQPERVGALSALLDGAGAALGWRRLREADPLTTSSLWHRDRPRTSQRRTFRELGSLVTVLLGGNRSGKTEGVAQYFAACAMGREHYSTQAWLRHNGLPVDIIPQGKARLWAVALDSGDSREYVRPAIGKYLPQGCKWRNRDGNGPAEVTTPTGGVIGFRSVDQGRDGFQGTAKDIIWFDEEPADEGVVNECLMRLADRRGKMLFSMTPLRGMTWLYDRWVEDPPEEVAVHWIHGTDNPHVPSDMLELLLSQYGVHERAARERGEFVALEGRVYADWQRRLHVVPSFQPPSEWKRYAGIDFGTRNPSAVLHAAHDPADDTLHIYSCWYQAEQTTEQMAAAIKAIEAESGKPTFRFADPAQKQIRVDLSMLHGIMTSKANKSVRAGISAVADRLRPDARGMPHLVVHDCCTPLIREIERYMWDSTHSSRKDQPDAPRKKDDHAMDALRYLVMGIRHLV